MKSGFLIALVTMSALMLAQPTSAADIKPAKRAEIEKLMAVTGMAKLAQQFSVAIVDSMVKAVRAAQPKITENVEAIISEEVNGVIAEHIGELTDQMAGVYDRYYTLEDLRALNQFYSSAIGRKVTSTMPTVMRDAMAIGQQWGRSLGPEIEQRIKDRCKAECTPTSK